MYHGSCTKNFFMEYKKVARVFDLILRNKCIRNSQPSLNSISTYFIYRSFATNIPNKKHKWSTTVLFSHGTDKHIRFGAKISNLGQLMTLLTPSYQIFSAAK